MNPNSINMTILGIESSCDDTAAALVRGSADGFDVLAEITASQIEVHKAYGGVVPEIAGRQHAEHILPVIQTVLAEQDKPNAIAVTAGPGLMTGLLVGTEAAKTLSYLWNIPLIAVNHIEGHIYSVLLDNPVPSVVTDGDSQLQFPALCLIVSGGHTEFILMNDHGVYEKIGGTRDDAVGEVFDKVAKMLDLEYPGGPKISELAITGNEQAIPFPRPMLQDDSLDMSFSGLKTAALYWLRDNPLETTPDKTIHDVCASFEQAIADVLVAKTARAMKTHHPKTLILSGGVSANTKIRTALETLANTANITFLKPSKQYCMDNAAMIAVAGYYHAIAGDYTPWHSLAANPVWRIYETTKLQSDGVTNK